MNTLDFVYCTLAPLHEQEEILTIEEGEGWHGGTGDWTATQGLGGEGRVMNCVAINRRTSAWQMTRGEKEESNISFFLVATFKAELCLRQVF